MSPVYTSDEARSITFRNFLVYWEYDSSYNHKEKWARVRLRLVYFLFVYMCLAVIGRAFYLQIIQADRLRTLAEKQHEMSSTPSMPAPIDISDIINDKTIFKLSNIAYHFKLLFTYAVSHLDVMAIITVIIGIAQVIVGYYPISRDKKAKKRMSEELTKKFFDSETIANATKYYVRTNCTSVDPSGFDEISDVTSLDREDLLSKIDQFIARSPQEKFILILADSGMGKTTFVLNYYVYNLCKTKRYRHNIEIVPLGNKEADSYIASISNPESTVLFLDGLDEDYKAVEDYHQRFHELSELCKMFKCVCITCRTQFFLTDDEIPQGTHVHKVGPRPLGRSKIFGLEKTYIAPFDDDDIQQFLRKCYPFSSDESRKAAQDITSKIPFLKVRPLLLAYVPEILRQNFVAKNTAQIYDLMVNGWLERETDEHNREDVRSFCESLAVKLYVEDDLRGNFGIFHADVKDLSASFDLTLQERLITGRSLLNRTSSGYYKFAHRSIMEFLVVKEIIKGNKACSCLPLTDLMRSFFLEAVCNEWPLSEEMSRNVLSLKFFIDFSESPQHAFHTKKELSKSLCELVRSRGMDSPIELQCLNRSDKELLPFLGVSSFLLLIRDLSLSLVSSDGNLTYDHARDDAFWLVMSDSEIDKFNLTYLPLLFRNLPVREQIGIISFLAFLGQKIGYDTLFTILNLAQNEIMLREDQGGKVVLIFCPRSPKSEHDMIASMTSLPDVLN